MTDFQRKLAQQEFPLHCRLNHENIVKGLEWSENDQEYVILMEYMNQPNYFREKIDVVRHIVIMLLLTHNVVIEFDTGQERD